MDDLHASMKQRLLFLGPPGVGKGTQAQILASKTNLEHLSTGDLLRAEVKAGTDLGKQVEGVMARGALVSDSLVLEIVRYRLKTNGGRWLLDGFPRNLSQAEALDALLKELDQSIELVVLLELDDAVLIQRLLGRGRPDDNETIIRRRLQVYQEQTAPLINHYRSLHLLQAVEASGKVEEIQVRIQQITAK